MGTLSIYTYSSSKFYIIDINGVLYENMVFIKDFFLFNVKSR